MEPQSNQVDVESLQKTVRRRGSCVDVFFGMSILILFVVVTALAVCGMLVVKELRTNFQNVKSEGGPKLDYVVASPSPSPVYKKHNFAYLKPARGILDNITMHWMSFGSGDGTSVGSNYKFDPDKNSLQPIKKGIYFIYIQVTVNCTYKCKAGVLKVEVFKKLTCSVELTEDVEKTPVSKKCWTVSQLDSEELITHMIVPKQVKENWSLDLDSSGVGMFLID